MSERKEKVQKIYIEKKKKKEINAIFDDVPKRFVL